jgi:hypothetical protein
MLPTPMKPIFIAVFPLGACGVEHDTRCRGEEPGAAGCAAHATLREFTA